MQITQQLWQVVYEGDHKGWNFIKYVTAHVEAHNNVEALRQYGYTGLPGFEKIDLFLQGICVPEFDTCRNQLLTNPDIMSVGHVKDHFISLPLRTRRRPLVPLALQPARCLPSAALVMGAVDLDVARIVDMVLEVDEDPMTLMHND